MYVYDIDVKNLLHVAPDRRLILYPDWDLIFHIYLVCPLPTLDFIGVRSATWRLQFD
jgi:hypothetical protein